MDIITTLFSFVLTMGGFAVLISVALQLTGSTGAGKSRAVR